MQKINERNKSFKVYTLVAAALLTAVSVALAPLNMYIPLFGVSSLRFSFTDIPVFLCGALFGPMFGGISGFLSDILGFIIAPAGPYFPGFTINKILVGFIPGIIFYLFRNRQVSSRLIKRVNMILAIVALLGSIFYINVVAIEDVKSLGTIIGMPANITLTILVIAIVGALMLVVKKITTVLEPREGFYKLQTILLVVTINYLLVNLICTPIWVHQLYNVPVFASVIVRVFKSIIDVPLQVIICYSILQAIPMKVRQKILC